MTAMILILLGVCGVAYYMMQKKSARTTEPKNPISPPPSYSKDELRIENVAAGGMVHVSGIGPDMDEFDVTILAKHLYREGGASWHELEGEAGHGKVWIDLEEDDELELSITLKKMKLRDIGLSKKLLKKIDDDEEGQLTYEGETYYYEDSDEATFYKNGDEATGERFYYWDFENDDGDKFVGVERWDDGSYDVSYSEPIKSHQVTVYSLKK
ncbi:MAG: DUF4178 domain-containing protein [Nitrospiria bacterium]